MHKSIPFSRTKHNQPALWERGGSNDLTGFSQIICGSNFEKLTAIYVVKRPFINGNHALFIVREGYHVIQCERYKEGYKRYIWLIEYFHNGSVVCKGIAQYAVGKWFCNPPLKSEEALLAADNKAYAYHCRRTHYQKNKTSG